MIVNFRVSVKAIEEKDPFMLEQFETRSEAESFHRSLIDTTNNGMLDAVPYKTMVIVFEEFLGGQWVVTNKKLVVQ